MKYNHHTKEPIDAEARFFETSKAEKDFWNRKINKALKNSKRTKVASNIDDLMKDLQ